MRTLSILCTIATLAFGRQGFGPGEQEWGFVDVRENAHIFYWLFYTTAAVQNVTQKPLVIWLQGGPGGSSTGYGNFAELGPLDVDLNPRNTSWVRGYNVLFVDNPVGTGFSYLENDAYATTNEEIAEDFLNFIKGFYDQNPIFLTSDLFIFCESYGGKMAAEIALNLYKAIEKGELNINFKGVGLGDSWISPIHSVLTWAPYLQALGIIDQNGYNSIQEAANATLDAIVSGNWQQATNLFRRADDVLESVSYNVDSYNVLKKISFKGRKKGQDILNPESYLREEDQDKLGAIMIQVQEALNISRAWGSQSDLVFDRLSEDFMKPVISVVEELLNTTDLIVAIYNGELDQIVDTPGTIQWVDNLNWEGSELWKSADRQPIIVDNIIEGYVKSVKNLVFYWVVRSGHMVPADNPKAMDYILEKTTNHKC